MYAFAIILMYYPKNRVHWYVIKPNYRPQLCLHRFVQLQPIFDQVIVWTQMESFKLRFVNVSSICMHYMTSFLFLKCLLWNSVCGQKSGQVWLTIETCLRMGYLSPLPMGFPFAEFPKNGDGGFLL